MKKHILDLTVCSVERLNERYVLIKLTDERALPDMLPGQFVEVRVDNSPSTMLRRPISINYVDTEHNQLWLLVAVVGEGTRCLSLLREGEKLNCLLPLGNGFTMPSSVDERILLIGGGVGTAPLLYFGKKIKEYGGSPTFLLGARSSKDLLELDYFAKLGDVHVTTEDGTVGEKGFVTNHSILQSKHFNRISTCGPKPMMVAVAKYALKADVPCEASLENMMACGLGACLCCVEKTTEGNLCVCKEGPVFDTRKLLWLNS
ncbi:MAG: dihydroorotate dehydrogenase electron transfer subunit [Prevotella sp.]|nr:dihydroorotate dehydrogenase electron transfer subunit [Prevotella sp.]